MARTVRPRRLCRGSRTSCLPKNSSGCARHCRTASSRPANSSRATRSPGAWRSGPSCSRRSRSCSRLLSDRILKSLLAYVASTRSEPLFYIQTILMGHAPGHFRSPARASRRHLPSVAQGVAVPYRCHRRPGTTDLRPRLPPAHPQASRLGTGAQRNRQRPRPPFAARLVAHRPRRTFRSWPAATEALCGPGEHAGGDRHLRLPCARQLEPADRPSGNLGVRRDARRSFRGPGSTHYRGDPSAFVAQAGCPASSIGSNASVSSGSIGARQDGAAHSILKRRP